jgi:hypothetical protein
VDEEWAHRRVRPEHVLHAASLAASALRPHVGADWSVRAGGLEWSVETTVVHVLGALTKESLYLASRSNRFIAVGMMKFRDATPTELVESIEPAAQALANVARSTPAGALAYHSTGMTDAEGYLAMGCGEVLMHTWDACCGLGVDFVGPSDLSSAILARTFPWVEIDDSPWQTLLWAFGRAARGGEAPVPDGLPGLRAPLEHWDGTPPQSRRADVVEWTQDATGAWHPRYA